jgi:signal transduction histidine kinase
MLRNTHPWELRFDWTLLVLNWGALILGVFLSGLDLGSTPEVALAALVAGTYVVAMQVMPRRLRQSHWIGETMAVAGVVTGLIAVGITGGPSSPYILFLAAPTFFAATFLGLRVGIETALLAGVGLIVVSSISEGDPLQIEAFQAMAIYVLIAVTFAQARRLLVEAQESTEALRVASRRDAERMERLEAAHNLLASLTTLADASELNPVAVGEAALRDLAVLVPFEAGEVALVGDDATVVVARRGEPGPSATREEFPMRVGDHLVGSMAVWPRDPAGLSGPERDLVTQALRPVALAFENILLLRTIAARAVREERTRLARELHDEIGPSLASLGLGLDLAINQHPTEPELARHLDTLRRAITGLVENVRDTVADLRQEPLDSVVQQANRLAAEAGADGPAVLITVDERRPPRAAIAADVGAILTEAVRNALEHAGATVIRIEGFVDHDEGKLIVQDDGAGFRPDAIPTGHFGLIGMRERAVRFGAALEVESTPGAGTRVGLRWGAP